MGRAELPLHAPGTKVDRGYIGQSVPRPNAVRLLQGRGVFTDDLRFPRLAHVAFFRSPYAHARIKKLDAKAAARSDPLRRAVKPAGHATVSGTSGSPTMLLTFLAAMIAVPYVGSTTSIPAPVAAKQPLKPSGGPARI